MSLVNKLRIYFRMALFAFRSTRQLNLGDTVVHAGRRWFISNGVCRPSWSLAEINGPGYLEYVHEADFRKERTVGNVLHDLRSTWRFYRGYWFDIWLRALSGDKGCAETIRHMPVK